MSYACGVLLLMARLVAERHVVKRLMRRASDVTDPAWTRLLKDCRLQIGVRRDVALLRSGKQAMPMTAGTWRPVIVIPSVADLWSEDRRRAVLLHELAHVARGDCLTQLLAAVACAVYWIHPGVWWVARRLRVEREFACDDHVLAAGTEPRDYAGHLLELAYALGGCGAPALAVSMARRRQVEGRMLAVLDPARARTAPTSAGRLLAGAVAALCAVVLAAAQAAVAPIVAVAAAPTPTPQTNSDTKAVAADGRPGTWAIRPAARGMVQLTLAENGHSYHGFTIPIDRLDGLSPSALTSTAGQRVQFSVRRDAGVLTFEGSVRSGIGAGTYTFAVSPTFPAELTRRGFSRPTAADQYLLARSDIGFAFLDELTAQGYSTPALTDLVRAAEHGVRLESLREMGRLGYRLGRVEALITMTDHGVSPEFVRELREQGLSLSADDLVRARDHGIDSDYVRELRALGYGPLSLDRLVHARDHGISADYVRGLRGVGLQITLDELVRARDHGIDSGYVQELASLGYPRLSLDTLVRCRDHGISPDFVRRLRDLGYRLTVDELVKARDHGVGEEDIVGYRAAGYAQLTLEDLIRLRDRGISPEYVRRLKAQGRSPLTVDELVRLHDQGVASDNASRSSDLLRHVHEHLRELSANVRDSIRSLIDSWAR